MRRRFSINDSGDLVDRDGVVLGKVVGITLDVASGSPLGGKGGFAVQGIENSQEKKKEGGVGETIAGAVRDVHAHFILAASPPQQGLSPSRDRMYRKALAETAPEWQKAEDPAAALGRGVAICKQAIDGLVAYAARKGGPLNLSRVFTTRPGGSPLGEQIEWWARQAPDAPQGGGVFLPSEHAAEISAAKVTVVRAFSLGGNEMAQREAEEAQAVLRRYGISVERVGNGARFIDAEGRDA